MHRCAAKCCDNTTSSMQEVHSCVERCSTLLKDVEHYVQNEFGTVQVLDLSYILICLNEFERSHLRLISLY